MIEALPFTHDPDGNKKVKTSKDNIISTYVYDGLVRLVSEEEKLIGQVRRGQAPALQSGRE